MQASASPSIGFTTVRESGQVSLSEVLISSNNVSNSYSSIYTRRAGKSNLSTVGDPHVGVGQDELADGRVEHEAVDAFVESDDPVEARYRN